MCFKGTELLPRGCSEETSRKFMELIFYEEIGQRGDLLKGNQTRWLEIKAWFGSGVGLIGILYFRWKCPMQEDQDS